MRTPREKKAVADAKRYAANRDALIAQNHARKVANPQYAVDAAAAFLRRNAESRDSAFRFGRAWTGPEIETALRGDLTAARVAELLGRTVLAVKNMRHKCKVDPRYADFGYWAS